GEGRGSDREAASPRRYGHQFPLAIGGEGQAGLDVVAGQVREVTEDLGLLHARGEILKHVVYRDPQSADTGLAPLLTRLDRDPRLMVHAERVPPHTPEGQTARSDEEHHPGRSMGGSGWGRPRPRSAPRSAARPRASA